jgi:hypothetical protein
MVLIAPEKIMSPMIVSLKALVISDIALIVYDK